jgi:hypothetical protein
MLTGRRDGKEDAAVNQALCDDLVGNFDNEATTDVVMKAMQDHRCSKRLSYSRVFESRG